MSANKFDSSETSSNSEECACSHECPVKMRAEEASTQNYFQFYGFLGTQQNMMQDSLRTSTYQKAILENSDDFRDRVVMDVGAGSGILSFFAAQAGAKKVYAVEASSMAIHCKELVKSNGLEDRITVLHGKIEEVSIPEEVDVIISEPLGTMLVNERMLESYVYARKFLKKGGKMFPTKAELRFALFTDDELYQDMISRCSFWDQKSFLGINLTPLKDEAIKETFSQPVIEYVHPDMLISKAFSWPYNFESDAAERLQRIDIPFDVSVTKTAVLHGIASWFNVAFCGSKREVWLSTSPHRPLTHWYQVRCLLPEPLHVQVGQQVKGRFTMIANDKRSYDMQLEVEVDGKKYENNEIKLLKPYCRYWLKATGQPSPPSRSWKINLQVPRSLPRPIPVKKPASCACPII